MSVGLVIFRQASSGLAVPISVDEWKNEVFNHDDLRLRSEPYYAINPRTGSRITIQVGEADSEIYDGAEWLPFLRYDKGRLTTEYQLEFDDPTNFMRIKVTAVAKKLRAVISTDAGGELLAW